MKRLAGISFFFMAVTACAQADTTKYLRGFPITGYMVELNDSAIVVQVMLPPGQVIKEKQLGLTRGVYRKDHTDTVQKGYGRCHLIKGPYYYFSISGNRSSVALKEGDLLYTMMDKPAIYFVQLPQLASHFILLQDVYEKGFFDRHAIFDSWTVADEKTIIDSMVKDIRFTGNYFLENDVSMDKLIEKGMFKGQKILSVMAGCQATSLSDFINYVIARPRLYAGREWKLAEVFTTWLSEGSPVVRRQ